VVARKANDGVIWQQVKNWHEYWNVISVPKEHFMHSKKIPVILLLLLSCSQNYLLAQEKGGSMITLTEGLVTPDELNGVTYTSYMDIPFSFTGALFLSYRYFITDHFAIGLSAGTDNVKGNLTEGNPNFNGGQDGTVGTYIRNTVTVAPELFLKYFQRGRVMIYGYAGMGYTFSRLEKAYNTQIYASGYQNGVNTNTGQPAPYLSVENPVYTNEGHANGQLTPFGLRVGDKLAWCMELGYGYKGLINTGLSFVF